jgi:hypothetical protein
MVGEEVSGDSKALVRDAVEMPQKASKEADECALFRREFDVSHPQADRRDGHPEPPSDLLDRSAFVAANSPRLDSLGRFHARQLSEAFGWRIEERAAGIEPASERWKRPALPLSYARAWLSRVAPSHFRIRTPGRSISRRPCQSSPWRSPTRSRSEACERSRGASPASPPGVCSSSPPPSRRWTR